MSNIQDYIKYVFKKHETLTVPPIHVYINRINNRLVVKIKDGYRLELQTPETMKIFDSTKYLIDRHSTIRFVGSWIPFLDSSFFPDGFFG